MKSIFYILIFCFSSISIWSQSTSVVDFKVRNKTSKEAILSLCELQNLDVYLSDNLFKSIQRNNYSFSKKPLSFIISEILKDESLDFELSSLSLTIFPKNRSFFTISGYIEDQYNGEKLIGANVFIANTAIGCNSNEYGFYSFEIESGSQVISYSYLGYTTHDLHLNLVNDTSINIQLEYSLAIEEIIIRDSISTNNTFNTILNYPSIDLSDFEIKPTLGGESDVIRQIQQKTGVQTGPDGLGGLHVRGGNADQNLILLDGVPIYNPFHAFGIFSLFDSDILNYVSYHSGLFPAKYNGRVSSIIDVRTKEGNNRRFGGKVSSSLFASKIMLEGPIQKEKSSFILSMRRTHLDPFFKRLSLVEEPTQYQIQKDSLHFYFGEVLLKANFQLSKKDKLFTSFYYGEDGYYSLNQSIYDNGIITSKDLKQQRLKWGNLLGVVRHTTEITSKLFLKSTLTYSQFNFNSKESQRLNYENLNANEIENSTAQNIFRSKITDQSMRVDFDYFPNTKHHITFGSYVINRIFKPGIIAIEDNSIEIFDNEQPLDSLFSFPTINTIENSIYIEDEFKLNESIGFSVGFNASRYGVQNTSYYNFEPRILVENYVTSQLKLGLAFSQNSQNVQVLSRSSFLQPSDLWVPSTAKIRPQKSWVGEFSILYQYLEKWNVLMKVYYKEMKNLITYSEGANFISNTITPTPYEWENSVTQGRGNSIGSELNIEYKHRSFMGNIGYSYTETDRQFEEINNGNPFPFRYDLNHILNIYLQYKLNSKSSISALFNFSSGLKINVPIGKWSTGQQQSGELSSNSFIYYGTKNSFSLQPSHRLDLNYNYRFFSKLGEIFTTLGVNNTYNNKNELFIDVKYDLEDETFKYYRTTFLPLLPYFKLSLAF